MVVCRSAVKVEAPRADKPARGRRSDDQEIRAMRLKNVLGKKTTVIAAAAVFALGLSSCGFADTSSAPASDPFQAGLYNAMNYDRLSVGLPPLTRGPKLENTAGTWAWQMMSVN